MLSRARGARLPACRRPPDRGRRNRCPRSTPTAACWPSTRRRSCNVPPVDNTQMDGYAVRAADCASGAAKLKVSQRIPAGHVGQPLQAGTAARIFTGAMIPAGADAVVMQEQCEAGTAMSSPSSMRRNPGEWIRRSGEDIAGRQRDPCRPARACARRSSGWPLRSVWRRCRSCADAARGGVLHRRRTGDAGRAAASPAPSTTRTASRCAACCKTSAAT